VAKQRVLVRDQDAYFCDLSSRHDLAWGVRSGGLH
jgi:hypothetical protein